MAERRSMTQALAMSPEKLTFIRGASATHDAVTAQAHPAEQIPPHAENAAGPTLVPDTSNRDESNRPILAHPAPPSSEPLVPLTTRLSASTAESLRRAHLEQKLHRRVPATQQEIVEEAVVEWLISRQFLS